MKDNYSVVNYFQQRVFYGRRIPIPIKSHLVSKRVGSNGSPPKMENLPHNAIMIVITVVHVLSFNFYL